MILTVVADPVAVQLSAETTAIETSTDCVLPRGGGLTEDTELGAATLTAVSDPLTVHSSVTAE